MTAALALLRGDRQARRFFLAHTQSSLGTGAAYVALLLLAYHRFHSPWAITLVLLADFLPAIALGPLLGAAVDRFGRRRSAVIADAGRALAFAGIWLAPSFALTVAFALIAGVGTALFKPAVLAGLPNLVDDERLPAATSLYGAIADLGHTLGPALAGAALLVTGPRELLLANAITFAVSAVLVARVDLGAPSTSVCERRSSLLGEARHGISVTLRIPTVRTLLIGSSLAILAAGMTNVGELQLAKTSLHAGDAGFSIFVALSGIGIVAGSLAAGSGAGGSLTRRYLLGLVAMAGGMLAAGLAPVFAIAAVAFVALGGGNGLASVSEQLLIQRSVPDELLGRAFGVKSALISGAFASSLLLGGLVTSLVGPRALFALAGAGLLCAAAWSAARLSREAGVERLGDRRAELRSGALPDLG
jgi:MFS family permease